MSKRTITFIIFIIVITSITFIKGAWALTEMNSDSYQIQWPNVNMGGGRKTKEGSYNLTDTLGQTAPGRYASTGYLVRAGFQYLHSIIPFTFTISSTSINLGALIPQTPSTSTNTLTVSAGGAGGYQVFASENHPLRSNQSDNIDDTTCDTGTCTETTAAAWTQSTTYGFGYRMDAVNNNIPTVFKNNPTYYKQFADKEINDLSQVVMSSASATRTATATVTYKANINAAQAAGNYENAITFIAVPGY